MRSNFSQTIYIVYSVLGGLNHDTADVQMTYILRFLQFIQMTVLFLNYIPPSYIDQNEADTIDY